MTAAAIEVHSISFSDAVRTWAKVGLLSFGGPAAQIALMHRLLIDEKQWVSEGQFLHALNFCMLLPGPEAQQLATYVGWLLHGLKGGLVAGLLFILPGAFVMLGLSAAYVTLGTTPAAAGVLFGLKAAVLVIVAQALLRIGGKALKSSAAWGLAAAAFAALYVFDVPFPVVVLGAGIIGYVAGRRGSKAFAGGGHGEAGAPINAARHRIGGGYFAVIAAFALLWLVPVAVLAANGGIYADIATFFSKMAVVTFGGAYAVLAYVADVAVEGYGWLRPGEMIDALGLAETTPGPLILVTQFVGFVAAYREGGGSLAAGTLGALVTTWVTFAPCFLWIFAGAPFIERLRGNAGLSSALGAITAAVVGVIANLALWFALHFLFARTGKLPDWASVDVAAVLLTAALAFFAWRWRPGVPVLLLAGVAGGMLAGAVRAAL